MRNLDGITAIRILLIQSKQVIIHVDTMAIAKAREEIKIMPDIAFIAAYQQGWEDAKNGKDYNNPYPECSMDAYAYDDGYDAYWCYDPNGILKASKGVERKR